MEICLVYFTGTFNTRKIANLIKQSLSIDNFNCDLFEFGKDNLKDIDFNKYDIIGLGYPIYGFNSPMPFNKEIRQLRIKNKRYFVFKTSGESFKINNVSSRVINRIMRRRKNEFLGEYHFLMPYNIHFRFDDRLVKEMMIMNHKLIEILSYNLKNNKKHKLNKRNIDQIFSFLISIQKIGGPINSFFYKVDKKKCILCKKCVEECPMKNIKLKNNRIVFSHKCAMCMRCSFYCPKSAIKIGFLEKWKVNGAYDFNRIESDSSIKTDFLKENSDGFYRCYIPTFKEIEEEYKEIIDK